MDEKSATNSVVHNEGNQQFELTLAEGAVGTLTYEISGNVMRMLSVQVPIEYRKRGHAWTITKAALEHAKTHNLAVAPVCPYVQHFLRKNTEYADMVSAG